MGRSAAVILFIGAVAAVAVYCAQRPTVAHGDVVEAELLEASPRLERVDSQDRIPIGLSGATFTCTATLDSGETGLVTFRLDREGHYSVVGQ
jgi:hypothetical protein